MQKDVGHSALALDAVLEGDLPEVALPVVAPGVIDAGEGLRVAAGFQGDQGAAMRAAVLESIEFAVEDPVRRLLAYQPALAVRRSLRRLGRSNRLRERLASESQTILELTRDKLNESVSLAVLDGEDVLFIARAAAGHIVSTGVSVGAHLPAFCSATGRILLSGMGRSQVAEIIGNKRYPRRTPKTLTSPAAIIREICTAAKTGYALSDEELELGMRSLAVPVHGADGSVIAAMSVSAFAARISVDDLIGRFLGILKNSAAILEQSINLS